MDFELRKSELGYRALKAPLRCGYCRVRYSDIKRREVKRRVESVPSYINNRKRYGGNHQNLKRSSLPADRGNRARKFFGVTIENILNSTQRAVNQVLPRFRMKLVEFQLSGEGEASMSHERLLRTWV